MYTVYVKKDSSAIIPVQKATIEEAEAFCADRDDVVDIKDPDGNTVQFVSPGEAVQPEPEEPQAPAVEEVEAAPAPTE
jgi:hypothetical protein